MPPYANFFSGVLKGISQGLLANQVRKEEIEDRKLQRKKLDLEIKEIERKGRGFEGLRKLLLEGEPAFGPTEETEAGDLPIGNVPTGRMRPARAQSLRAGLLEAGMTREALSGLPQLQIPEAFTLGTEQRRYQPNPEGGFQVFEGPPKVQPPLRGSPGDVFLDPTGSRQIGSIPAAPSIDAVHMEAARQQFPNDPVKQSTFLSRIRDRGSVSRASIAIQAASDPDPNKRKEAERALSLMGREDQSVTIAELSLRAAAGDRQALAALGIMRRNRLSPFEQQIENSLNPSPNPNLAPPPNPVNPPPPPPGAAPQSGFDRLPDPRTVPKKIARDTVTGARFRSDGTKWIPVPSR